MRNQSGFTLLELMIAVAIVVIISSIGYQFYTGYIETADTAVLEQNIDSMRVFQEDARLRTGSYAQGNYDVHGGDTSIKTAIGWSPDDKTTAVRYVVQTVASGAGYKVTATAPDGQSAAKCFGDGCP